MRSAPASRCPPAAPTRPGRRRCGRRPARSSACRSRVRRRAAAVDRAGRARRDAAARAGLGTWLVRPRGRARRAAGRRARALRRARDDPARAGERVAQRGRGRRDRAVRSATPPTARAPRSADRPRPPGAAARRRRSARIDASPAFFHLEPGDRLEHVAREDGAERHALARRDCRGAQADLAPRLRDRRVERSGSIQTNTRPRRYAGSFSAARELADAGTGQSRSQTGTRRSTTSVYAVPNEREAVAEARPSCGRAAGSQSKRTPRAPREIAERPGALPVAGALAPVVHDEGRVREELPALHRDLPRAAVGAVRVRVRSRSSTSSDAVRLEREDVCAGTASAVELRPPSPAARARRARRQDGARDPDRVLAAELRPPVEPAVAAPRPRSPRSSSSARHSSARATRAASSTRRSTPRTESVSVRACSSQSARS